MSALSRLAGIIHEYQSDSSSKPPAGLLPPLPTSQPLCPAVVVAEEQEEETKAGKPMR